MIFVDIYIRFCENFPKKLFAMMPSMERKVRRFLAETRRSWRDKLTRHKAKKPFARTFDQLAEHEKETLQKWNLKPLEEVVPRELKRCSKAALDVYCVIYGIPRTLRSDVIIEELIFRKNFIAMIREIEEEDFQQDQPVATLGKEEPDVKQVAFRSPFERFLHSRKKLGTQTCSDVSSVLCLAFELFQTGRAKGVSCLLPLFLRRTKTSLTKHGSIRETAMLSCKALAYEKSQELVRLLSRFVQVESIEQTLSLNDLGEVPSSMAMYSKRALLELEQGKVASLNLLVFIRWYLKDYLSAINDISVHYLQFPYSKYRMFYLLLASFFCLEAYRELGFNEELTLDTGIPGQMNLDHNLDLGYVFPFNFLKSWDFLLDFVQDSSAEKQFAVDYFEKALDCLERCADYGPTPNIFVILKSIILAYGRNVEEAVGYMEEFIQEKGNYNSYLLENYLRCLEVYQTMLSSTDATKEASVLKKRVTTAQHLLSEVNPFSSIALDNLSIGFEKHLSSFEDALETVACHLDYLGNMESRFLFYVDFWKSSYQYAWQRFAELLSLCDDPQVESLWKERHRCLWWPSRFFSYSSLQEDYKYYPDIVSYKTLCVRKLMGISSEYEFFQQREPDDS